MSKIKTERFYRSATVELVGRENDDRRIEVAFSSEEPVERPQLLSILGTEKKIYFWFEILKNPMKSFYIITVLVPSQLGAFVRLRN